MNKQICLNRSVLHFMGELLKPHGTQTVLEFGSGWSSAWFAKRCHQLVTVETDRNWARLIQEDLKQTGLTNWQMILARPAPVVFGSTVDRQMAGRGEVDLVLIDCRADLRDAATHLGWRFLKPGGWILFDDAQRAKHFDTLTWLTDQMDVATALQWSPGDIDTARERLTLAWQK